MDQLKLENRSLGELFGLTDDKVKRVLFPVNTNTGPMVPRIEQTFFFQQDHVRRMMLWIGGIAGRNLLITGPTGCGKSSLVEQFCARLGRELYRVPCHGKLEFSEMTGQLTVLSDGSTKFIHGPLPRAMQNGSVLLLDEMNFIHPSAIGALNTVLDGGPLLIPETGELIEPHGDFRIVATGNAIEHGDDSTLYRGTQRMNLALIQRFLMLKASYLSPTDEAVMLHNVLPGIPGNVVKVMVGVASDVREAFSKGDIESTVSTRTLVKWGRVLQARVSVLAAQPEEELSFSLQFVLTGGLKPEDAKAIEGVLQRLSSGIVVNLPGDSTQVEQPPVSSSQSQADDNELVEMNFLVNPNRDGQGSKAFWVGVNAQTGSGSGLSLNGTLSQKPVIRVIRNKDQAWISGTLKEKYQTRGYRISGREKVRHLDAENVARDVVKALSQALIEAKPIVKCQSADALRIAGEITKQMGHTASVLTC